MRRFESGSVLIQEGDVGDSLFLIVSGRVRAYSAHESNGREITYGTYGPGEYVGELGLDGGLRSANVVALERSWCSVVVRATLESHLRDAPAFAFELLSKVIRRARAATLTARQLALNDVYGRLRALLHEDGSQGEGGIFLMPSRMTHREIAHRIGCTREMVSRILRDLERGGHIEIGGRGEIGWRRPLPPRW